MGRFPVYWLWISTGLFLLRVVGQVLVVVYAPSGLPPMDQWYSGLLPYPLLLPTQILILMLMSSVNYDNSRGTGFFLVEREAVRTWLIRGSALYFGVMVLRYGLTLWLRPEARWFGGAIPIVFHCVLASYLYAVAKVGRSRPYWQPSPKGACLYTGVFKN